MKENGNFLVGAALVLTLVFSGPAIAAPDCKGTGSGAARSTAGSGNGDINSCSSAVELTPDQEFARVRHLVEGNFIYQDRLKDPTWRRWDRAPKHFLSNVQAEKAIGIMLMNLGDPYTCLDDRTAPVQEEEAPVDLGPTLLTTRIGYLPFKHLEQGAAHSLQLAIEGMPDARAYVLDLRGNMGGSAYEAVLAFELLAQQGEFVKARGRMEGKPFQEQILLTEESVLAITNGVTEYQERQPNLTDDKPIVVLIDGDTGSATEMLAAALRDCGRATLVGTNTFGKGIMQRCDKLRTDVYAEVTIARWYRSNDLCVHGVGIQPDIFVKRIGMGDSQFRAAARLLMPSR